MDEEDIKFVGYWNEDLVHPVITTNPNESKDKKLCIISIKIIKEDRHAGLKNAIIDHTRKIKRELKSLTEAIRKVQK